MKQKFYSLFVSLLIYQSLSAQNDGVSLNFDLSVLYRFELWNGMNAKNYLKIGNLQVQSAGIIRETLNKLIIKNLKMSSGWPCRYCLI